MVSDITDEQVLSQTVRVSIVKLLILLTPVRHFVPQQTNCLELLVG